MQRHVPCNDVIMYINIICVCGSLDFMMMVLCNSFTRLTAIKVTKITFACTFALYCTFKTDKTLETGKALKQLDSTESYFSQNVNAFSCSIDKTFFSTNMSACKSEYSNWFIRLARYVKTAPASCLLFV